MKIEVTQVRKCKRQCR